MASVLNTYRYTSGWSSSDSWLEIIPRSRGWSRLHIMNSTNGDINVDIGHTSPAVGTSYLLGSGKEIILEAPSMANGPVHIHGNSNATSGFVTAIF